MVTYRHAWKAPLDNWAFFYNTHLQFYVKWFFQLYINHDFQQHPFRLSIGTLLFPTSSIKTLSNCRPHDAVFGWSHFSVFVVVIFSGILNWILVDVKHMCWPSTRAATLFVCIGAISIVFFSFRIKAAKMSEIYILN